MNRHNYLISLETASKFPLQQAQLGIRNGLSDVHRRQQVSLLTVNIGDACERHPLVDGNALALNPSQLRQRTFWRSAVACGLQALAHHAVQNQRHKANTGVSANALRQSVIDRRNLNLGFEHPKAPLDVGQALVALHDLGRFDVRYVGHQQQLAVHHLGAGQCLGIDVEVEKIRLKVDLERIGNSTA
jgi:hypothetical protein